MAAASESCETLRLLLDHGANINAMSATNYSALMVVPKEGDVDSTHLLIERGADLTLTTSFYDTALELAESKEMDSVVKAIMDRSLSLALP